MSTDDTRPPAAIQVPGFPGVSVCFLGVTDRLLNCFEYRGTAEDLIACEAATPDMFSSINAMSPCRRRLDAEGEQYRVRRSWRSTDIHGQPCEPYRWYCLTRITFRCLPGGVAAAGAYERCREWERNRWGHSEKKAPGGMSIQARQPQLRLVVNNCGREEVSA